MTINLTHSELVKLSDLQEHVQWVLVPKEINLLSSQPVVAFARERHIKVEKHARQDEAHFRIRQAATLSATANLAAEPPATYFLPMQSRGPVEKGWDAPLLSLAKRSSRRNLSG